MSLSVATRVDGRSADRVAAVPSGWVTASSHAVTRWDQSADGSLIPATESPLNDAVSGPLTWLTEPETLGWGPLPYPAEGPAGSVRALLGIVLADLGEGAVREFDLAVGAIAGDARLTFVSARRRQSRVRGAATRGDTARSAIVDIVAGSMVEPVDGPVPVAAVWGDGPLVLGHPGRVRVRRDDGSWVDHDLSGPAAARSIGTRKGAGVVIAGTAAGVIARFDRDGNRSTWEAHQGPVTAVAAGPGMGSAGPGPEAAGTGSGPEIVVTGGSDGMVRVWADGERRNEFAAGAPVAAVAGPVGGAIAVLLGGAGGSLLILRGADLG